MVPSTPRSGAASLGCCFQVATSGGGPRQGLGHDAGVSGLVLALCPFLSPAAELDKHKDL